MKTKFFAFALSLLFAMPCILRAEEIEIHLMEIIQMGTPLGDSPLDNPEQVAESANSKCQIKFVKK